MNNTKIVTYKIREILRNKNLTNETLTEIWDCCSRTVTSILSGKRTLTWEEICTFAEKMNMDPLELIKSEDEKVVMHNTFNHQKGNGVYVNQTISEGEREQLLLRIQEKNEELKRCLAREQRKDEEIEFLREMLRSKVTA